MNLNVKKFLSLFFITFFATFFLHLLSYWSIPQLIKIDLDFLLKIYFFLLALSLVHFFILKVLFKNRLKYAGFIFTGMGLLKMALSILFLIPYIYPPKDNSIAHAMNFMFAYFVFLFFEVVFIVKNLQKTLNLPPKNDEI